MKIFTLIIRNCFAFVAALFLAANAHADDFAGLWHTDAPNLKPGLDTSGLMSLAIAEVGDDAYSVKLTLADRVPSVPSTPWPIKPVDGRLRMVLPELWPIPSGGRYFTQPVFIEIASVKGGRSLDVTFKDSSNYKLDFSFFPDTDPRFDRFKVARLAADGSPVTEYRYRSPSPTRNGLPVSTLRAEGIDQAAIEKAVSVYMSATYSRRPGFLLLVRNGKLVLEEYFFGTEPDRLWLQHSVSKSITSMLAGIAVEDGALDIDASINSYFPEFKDTPWMRSTPDAGVTARHLLFMANVVGWSDENYTDAKSRFITTFEHPQGFVGGIFQYPVITTNPDPYFNYNTQITNLLGEVIARATDEHLSTYMQRKLFTPIGESRSFFLTATGTEGTPVEAGSTVGMRPMAMAKIGQLMLDRGRWKGKQIIPADWVTESTSIQALKPNPSTQAYGYKWWHQKYEFGKRNAPVRFVYAGGRGGQIIGVLPEYDTVIITGALDFKSGGTNRQFKFVDDHILPIFNDGLPVKRLEMGAEDLGVVVLD